MATVGASTAVLLLCCLVLSLGAGKVECGCKRPPVLFNFGDSNSDTGGLEAGLGYLLGDPQGRVFFHRPSGRVCDGRLVIDFLCEHLGTMYLSPYMESLGSDFSNGANFAIAGSSTQPPYTPFNLAIQVNQFLRFKSRSLELNGQGGKGPVDPEGFRNALYSFDIGQNDLANAFSANLTYDQVVANIPSVISEIKKAIMRIYDNGGRNFWVHNTGPIGCLPQKLALPRKDNTTLDSNGCLAHYNNAAKMLNSQLSELCKQLGSELKNATVVHTDLYAIKYDLIANHTAHGFVNPLMACCGSGGPPYNFDQRLMCGNPACPVCADGSKAVSWDGIHYTEAANAVVATKILTTDYSKPKINFDFFCNN